MRKLKNFYKWARMLASPRPKRGDVRVFYGRKQIPGMNRYLIGGAVKFQRMQDLFPNSASSFNVLYLGSTNLPKDFLQLTWIAKKKKAAIVYNQDGVSFRAWHGEGWEPVNERMRAMLNRADHVFYQSEFSKSSADQFLGSINNSWEILYNAVDTSFFTSQIRPNRDKLVILLGGTQFQWYPLENAFRTLAELLKSKANAHLVVTGRLTWESSETEAMTKAKKMTGELGIDDHVSFLGAFTQNQAPEIYNRADILLHTKCYDPCPSVVIEAMSCGLPVVYASSGGVPELVGTNAGIGVPTPLDWEKVHPADPEQLATAILKISAEKEKYSIDARERAVAHFDIKPWLARHREVFQDLTMKL